MPPFDQILKRLRNAGVPFTLHEHEPIRTVAEVQAKLPHLVPHMVKTIAFRTRHGRNFFIPNYDFMHNQVYNR